MAADSSTVRFSRLNDTNYAEWALRMEAILVRADLWSMVHVVIDEEGKDTPTIAKNLKTAVDARPADKQNQARAEIILRVEDGQLAHCMRSSDPREIWRTLESVHRAAGFATSLALRRQFLTMKKASTQSMQAWIGQVQALAFRLSQAGIAVTDQDKILALTMGLPTSYEAVIINFDSTASDQLTLNHVVARLLNEEVRQIATPGHSDDTGPGVDHRDEAMAVTGAKARRTKLGPNPDVLCFFCDKKGHYKSECPEKRAWEKSKKQETAAYAFGLDSDSDEDASEDDVMGYF